MSVRPIFRNAFIITRPMATSGFVSSRALRSADQALVALQKRVKKLLQSSLVLPSDQGVQLELAKCESFAKSICDSSDALESPSSVKRSSASTLLSLETGQGVMTPSFPSDFRPTPSLIPGSPRLTPSLKKRIAEKLSELADSIINEPKVFITRGILSKYVSTQILLGSPAKIPQAFILYASKPIPKFRRKSIEFKSPNPAKPSSAISLPTAQAALEAAVAAKDLSLCFDIIDTSVCTDAFLRSKIIRRTPLPILALITTPPAAYALATQLANYQNTLDVSTFTNMIFVGTLAYVGFSATIGFVAVTTANDQMNRITWASGTPLRERWLREEERALVDRVASAWGFQELNRRGEEEGYEWEALREWVGLRGMVLDRPELMEGME